MEEEGGTSRADIPSNVNVYAKKCSWNFTETKYGNYTLLGLENRLKSK